MRAAYIDALGDAASIRCGELPDPVAARGQALVRVDAVAVNMVDTYVRSGRWPTEVAFPLALGRDLVGSVAAVGPGVTDLEPGQRVWTNSAGYGGRAGASAELVVVDRDRLYPLPPAAPPAAAAASDADADADAVSFVAAVHPGATAYGALIGRARLQAGERVAVVGANGAVGMCMVQAAASRGAEIVAVIRDRRAAERLRALGATHVVVAEASQAPPAAVAAVGGGVDVFVDASGQVDVGSAAEQLKPRGRILLIAGLGRVEMELWRLYVRETQILGFVMSGMSTSELAAAAQWINASAAEQRLSVTIGAVLSFDDAARSHAMLEAGQLPRMADGTVGRLVLRP